MRFWIYSQDVGLVWEPRSHVFVANEHAGQNASKFPTGWDNSSNISILHTLFIQTYKSSKKPWRILLWLSPVSTTISWGLLLVPDLHGSLPWIPILYHTLSKWEHQDRSVSEEEQFDTIMLKGLDLASSWEKGRCSISHSLWEKLGLLYSITF